MASSVYQERLKTRINHQVIFWLFLSINLNFDTLHMDNKTISYIFIVVGGLTMLGGLGAESFFPFLIGGGATLYGWQRLRSNQKTIKAAKKATRFEMSDEMIVRLAKRLGGRLSAEELASQTSLSINQAKERLEALHNKGVCDIDLDRIDERGRIFYSF